MEDEAEQRLTNSDQAAIDTEQETVIYGVQTPSVDLEVSLMSQFNEVPGRVK